MMWFESNYMRVNLVKYNRISYNSSFNSSMFLDKYLLKQGKHKICETRTGNILGVDIDKNLRFDEH